MAVPTRPTTAASTGTEGYLVWPRDGAPVRPAPGRRAETSATGRGAMADIAARATQGRSVKDLRTSIMRAVMTPLREHAETVVGIALAMVVAVLGVLGIANN